MGSHNCLYYHSQKDLESIVASFLKEGIQKNEFCLWIIPEGLEVEAAKAVLRETLANLDESIETGQLEILEAKEWYPPSGEFNSEKVLAAWAQKERQALARGFSAVCGIGDGSWFPVEDRETLVAYEKMAQGTIPKSKVSALCTYSVEKFDKEEIRVLSEHHDATLSHFNGALAILNKDRKME